MPPTPPGRSKNLLLKNYFVHSSLLNSWSLTPFDYGQSAIDYHINQTLKRCSRFPLYEKKKKK